MEIATIVAGVDGSPGSLLAVDWAAHEAHRRGLGLRLVNACVRERYGQGVADDGERGSERSQVQDLLSTAAKQAEAECPGLRVESEVIPDEPVSGLLDLQRLAPLLVLGAHGAGGFAGLLLGSVSLRVAARAEFPVVVVRGPGQRPSHQRPRVVLGLGPNPSAEATRFAVREAVLRQADLHLVHAWPSNSADAFALMNTAAKHVAHLLDTPEPGATGTFRVQVEHKSEHGPAAKVLLHQAGSADLVVVGAHRRQGHLGMQLGPVNHAVLHHAPCPVAVVAGQDHPDPDQVPHMR
ncbi:universal stress protein [Streptacidiphilus sp. PAMC 29251]